MLTYHIWSWLLCLHTVFGPDYYVYSPYLVLITMFPRKEKRKGEWRHCASTTARLFFVGSTFFSAVLILAILVFWPFPFLTVSFFAGFLSWPSPFVTVFPFRPCMFGFVLLILWWCFAFRVFVCFVSFLFFSRAYLVQQFLQHREVDLAHDLVYVDSGQPLPVQLSVPGQRTCDKWCRGWDVGVAG